MDRDQTLFDQLRFIPPEKILRELQVLHKGMVVTQGSYEIANLGQVSDLDWNHMDQHHRPVIHRTYNEAIRMGNSENFQFSITKFGNYPLFIPVTDIYVKPGLFYQAYCVFSVVIVISVIQMLQEGEQVKQKIDWYIASSRWFKFMHQFLNRRLLKLNQVQNDEDIPIREQRCQLRLKGYKFKTDCPDFLNSNSPLSTPNVIPPPLTGEYRFDLGSVSTSEVTTFAAGPIDILVKADADEGILVWPAVCPHEGGPLEEGDHIPVNVLRCPWHALKIPATRLSEDNAKGSMLDYELALEGKILIVGHR
jgi:hypothetical protein